jgi:crotonobetainyl-CoA:carnitine CoA-transferase CaiB-like acyl-CoA transferase
MGDVVLPTSPLRFHGSPDPSITLEPDIGGHTDQVLMDWLNFDEPGVTALREVGAIR